MFSAAKAQCLTSYRATPMASRHTLLRFNRLMLHSRSLQARCFAAPRQGLSAGCAYPKSCTMPLARSASHRPLNTCQHRQIHEITPSSLEVVSIDDFRSAKISEKAEAKVRRRNQYFVLVLRHTLAHSPHIPLASRASLRVPIEGVGGS